jgi:hypothetical protein
LRGVLNDIHSPACLLAFAITAVTLGELKEAWVWNDGPVPEGEKKIE